jgi:hypothetical protein
VISLDGLDKRQEIEIEILARVVQSAEVKGADRVEPFGLGEPVSEAVLFKPALLNRGALRAVNFSPSPLPCTA